MADKLKLDFAIADYPHTAAILSGAVPIEGIEPNFIKVVPQIAAYRRMARKVEFDVREIAPTTYIMSGRAAIDTLVQQLHARHDETWRKRARST